MSAQNRMADAVDPDWKWTYRIGGISGLLFGIAYIVIIALYVPMGAPPSGAEARLAYHAGNITLWWTILGLSVLTDFLLIPLALSLYLALKGINKNVTLLGIAFILLFVLLDLAITWPNYATLITLSSRYALAANDTERVFFVTAAMSPSIVLESSLLFIYNTLTLSVGILMVSLVMLKGIFNKATAYLGIATGIFGVVAVFGPFLLSAFSVTIIFASIFTTLWVMFAGHRLYRLG